MANLIPLSGAILFEADATEKDNDKEDADNEKNSSTKG
jgi:hypothetical protein